MLLVPVPFIKAPSPSGITMTAGTDGTYTVGYSDGSRIAAFGSISSEPWAGQALAALYYISVASSSGVTYPGDVATALSATTLYIDDVPYSLAAAIYDSGTDTTNVQWTGGTGPAFSNGVQYNIRIE